MPPVPILSALPSTPENVRVLGKVRILLVVPPARVNPEDRLVRVRPLSTRPEAANLAVVTAPSARELVVILVAIILLLFIHVKSFQMKRVAYPWYQQ